MSLTDKSILLASFLGEEAVKKVPRMEAVQNELGKHVLPARRFIPLKLDEDIATAEGYEDINDLWMNDTTSVEKQFFPLSFKSTLDDDFYLLPWEPSISIEAANVIAKRRVAKWTKKQKGSIKERFATDDYQITITGSFFGDKLLGKPAQTYPRRDIEKLRDYLLSAEAIEVQCELLQIYDIRKIVIESVRFPFTKGENVQGYEIKAISEFPYDLIYKHKKITVEMGIGTQEK